MVPNFTCISVVITCVIFDILVHAYKYSYVMSEPYSRVPGDRNWRHHVVDMHVFVSGPLHMLPGLQEVFKGNNVDVHGLTVRTWFCSIVGY